MHRYLRRHLILKGISEKVISILPKGALLDEIKVALKLECDKSQIVFTGEEWSDMFSDVLIGLS